MAERNFIDFPIVVSEAVPEGAIRVIDMAKVRESIGIVDEPRPVTISSQLEGDVLRVTVSQRALRFIDLKTGRIL